MQEGKKFPNPENERAKKISLTELMSYMAHTPDSDNETLDMIRDKIDSLAVGESWVYEDPTESKHQVTKLDRNFYTVEDLDGLFSSF